MNRRSVLTAIPAVTVVGTVPAAAAIETPVMRVYREWKAALEAWETANFLSEAEAGACCNAVFRLADKVLDQPSAGSMDFVYKLMAQSFFGAYDIGDCPRGQEIWAEARALVT